MRKQGYLAVGLAIGLMAGSCASAFAAGGIQEVKAYINSAFNMTVDGQATTLADGYTMLVYQDRTYVPVRAIGELVGANIDWDDTNKTVIIEKAKPIDSNPEDQPDTSTTTTSDSTNYNKLPISKEGEKYKISVLTYSTDVKDDFKKLGIRLEALKTDTNVRINQSKTTYVINGVTYDYNKSTNNLYRDEKWYTSFASKDNPLEGYLVLPDLPLASEDEKPVYNIHMVITVIEDTYAGQVPTEVEFDISVS